MNCITLYANGIGDFNVSYEVSKNGTEVNIPVKKEYLGDAINLCVFSASGKDAIRVIDINFTPENADSTVLKVDSNNAFSLFNMLSGSFIRIVKTDDKVISGTLVGVDSQEQDFGEYKIQTKFLTIIDNNTYVRIPVLQISAWSFEPKVQKEIDKALANNYHSITPQSNPIRLRLAAKDKEKATAVISYTMPVAVWSMVYQIRKINDDYRFVGIAIVHNNTDQNWENCFIRCVTGIPYTVKSTAAKQRVLERIAAPSEFEAASGGRSFSHRKFKSESMSDFGEERISIGSSDFKDVGDFCVFSPKSTVNIPSNSSSPLEVINENLSNCTSVLYYKFGKSKRPEMALKFTNSMKQSLQAGTCNVYEDNVFKGTAWMPNVKPNQEEFLLHGEDTSVKISRKGGNTDSTYNQIEIQKGVISATQMMRTTVTYKIKSLKSDSCEVVVDHVNVIPNSTISSDVDGVDIDDGKRYTIKVPANKAVDFEVVEVYCIGSSFEFTINWLNDNVISVSHPALKMTKGLDVVLKISKQLEDTKNEIARLDKRFVDMDKHQKDIRANLQVATGSAHVQEWQKQLSSNDKEMAEIRLNSLPKLTSEQIKLENEFRVALKKVVMTWKE